MKMIVTDLDWTLLRDDKSISEFTINTLKKFRNNGFKIVFATARGETAREFFPTGLFDGYVIMNGAVAYKGSRKVYSKLVSMDIGRDILIRSEKHGLRTAAVSGGFHYANFDVNKVWNNIGEYVETDFSKLEIDAEKLYMIVEDNKDIEFIESFLPKELYMTVSRDNLAQIMNVEATKSKGIFKLAEHWGILPKDIVAFGDDHNDYDMIKKAGIGVAMGNAIEEIKDVADFICNTNEDDGVANWLLENM